MEEEKKKEEQEKPDIENKSKIAIGTILTIGEMPDGSIALHGQIHNPKLCLYALEMAKHRIIAFNDQKMMEKNPKPKLIKPGTGFKGLLDRFGKIRK